MKKYEIRTSELVTAFYTWEVEAESEEEAISKIKSGLGGETVGEPEYDDISGDNEFTVVGCVLKCRDKKTYTTVELHGGVLEKVRTFLSKEDAEEHQKAFIEKHYKSVKDYEEQLEHGMPKDEIHLVESELE
jgi:hypothetical protein